jgi:hypothetical protein
MTGLTRRQFLKRTGLLGAALTAPVTASTPAKAVTTVPVAEFETTARAFSLSPVYAERDPDSAVIGQLAPDSVHSVVRAGDWYQVEHGYVPRSAMQPIVPYSRPVLMESPGFWAELIAPVSAIRKWCAAHAPIVARLGFGAVVYVVDRLVDDAGQVWYGLAAEGDSALVGWSAGLQFRFTSPPSQEGERRSPLQLIRIDARNSVLSLYAGKRVIGEIEIHSPVMVGAKTTLQAVQPGAVIDMHRDISMPLGLPWLMQLGTGQRVHGAFWHNRFGSVNHANESSAVELPPLTARYLYGLVLNPVPVEIV